MVLLIGLVATSVGVGSCHPYGVCVAPAGNSALPRVLSQTGLWADTSARIVAGTALPYRPSFELWSDGATKRRWIELPPGSNVESEDMDAWSFPVGTKVWKEFSVHERLVETRLLQRNVDGGWVGVSYVWNADQTEAFATPAGLADADGTDHDVPSAADCHGCHGGRRSYLLGFSAIQLSHAAAPPEINLDALVARRILSVPPSKEITIPGDETERWALGYLHANCGACHNRDRPRDKTCFNPRSDLDLWLRTDRLASLEETPAYATAFSQAVVKGAPDDSLLLRRMKHGDSLGPRRMPPLATEQVDDVAVAALGRWIERMKP